MALPSKPRVLIADDEKLIADTLALILNHGGFDAHAVYTSRSALEMARELQPDMLITDVLMSPLNGVDAAMQMRRLLPGLRVFLLSGQLATAEMLASSQARDMGFEVLIKPMHPRDLISRLQSAIPVKSVA